MPRTPILLAALALLLLNIFAILSNRHMVAAGDVDFRALYAAGTLLRTQPTLLYSYQAERTTQNAAISPRQIALPYLYPPAAALPFAALSLLPYLPAYLTFLAINLALLWLATRLLRPPHEEFRHSGTVRHAGDVHHPPRRGEPASALGTSILPFLFLPTAIALFQGQISILLLLALVAAHRAIESKKLYLAGLLLATLLLKPQLALPIALLFLFWRAWPLLVGFLTGATAVTLLSLAAAGPKTFQAYLQTLTTATSGTLGQYPVFSSPMPNLHGLAILLTPGHAVTVTIILSVVILLYTAIQPLSLPRATVAALLVSYHLHLHDLTLLLLPIALTFRVDHPLRRRPIQLTALLWLFSPLHLLMMATGLNGLFVPLMLPFLL